MIVLVGESASGKSTIEQQLTLHGYNKIVSYTTRPMRTNEVNGNDYWFVSQEEFQKLLNDNFFAEHTVYNSWFYGIAKKDCLDNRVVVVEPHGFRQLQRIADLSIVSFYIQVPERERLKRMVDRGDNLMEVFRRIFSDQGVFQGMSQEVNYVIENNDIHTAVNEILKILTNHK